MTKCRLFPEKHNCLRDRILMETLIFEETQTQNPTREKSDPGIQV